jgi:hypothetical protein
VPGSGTLTWGVDAEEPHPEVPVGLNRHGVAVMHLLRDTAPALSESAQRRVPDDQPAAQLLDRLRHDALISSSPSVHRDPQRLC